MDPNFALEKYYGKPDLLLVYKNHLIVKILAALFAGWVLFVAPLVAVCVTWVKSVVILRYQMKNLSGIINVSDSGTQFAITAFDCGSLVALLLVGCWCWAVILEILTLSTLMARAVR